MAEKTLSFTEVKPFNKRELKQLEKKTYSEIFYEFDSNFCVPVKNANKFLEIYEEIIPYCQKITAADGIEVFVAKIKRYLVCTDPTLLIIMKDSYSAVDERYNDVTALGGEQLEGLNFINWAIKTQEIVREKSFIIPKVKKGSRLFFTSG